jgi:hypothetical protein
MPEAQSAILPALALQKQQPMDDIQRPASVPGFHCMGLPIPLHAQDEVRIGAIQQIEPFMAVGNQTVQIVLIGVALARDEMVD